MPVSVPIQEVTGAMVQTFLAGGAGINAIARHVNAEVFVVDMGIIAELSGLDLPGSDHLVTHKIAPGTADFTQVDRPHLVLGILNPGIQQVTGSIAIYPRPDGVGLSSQV